MRWVPVIVAMLVVSEAGGQSGEPVGSDEYPHRPIKVIVPFAAGGGSDTFVRILQKSIEENDLLSQPLVIINVPGAGGTIGSRQAMDSDPDGYTLMCLHDGIITAKHAGIADYGPEAFEAIAGTGEVGTVIAVADAGKYADLKALLDDAAARPQEIVFAANVGAPSHFAGMMLEGARPGARFRYTQTGGGAKRFAALAGGHIDVSSFSLAEYMQFRSAGLRGLAYCGASRHSSAPDLPTAREQGFDVTDSIMQMWWAPKETLPRRIRAFADVLQQAMRTQQVQQRLAAIYTDRTFLTGDALRRSINERERSYANVAQHELTALPNFPAIVLAFVAILSLVVGLQHLPFWQLNAKVADEAESNAVRYPTHPRLAAAVVAVTGLYIFVMQTQWLGFRIATASFIIVVGLMLTPKKLERLPILGGIAFAMSVGLHYVLTNVFAIALP